MKTYKIDEYTVKTKKRDGNSNHELSVQLFKDKKLYSGTILKTSASDVDILKWAIGSIKNKPFEFQNS